MAGTAVLDPTQFGFLVRAFTVLFATGLAYIAFVAWRRRKRSLMLFVCVAFLAYLIRDIIRLSELAFPQTTSPVLLGLADVLDLLTLVLIFFAVLRE